MSDYCDDTINVKKYQAGTAKTAKYPKEKAIEYLALGLCSEAGEVAGKVKKFVRGDQPNMDIDAISAELGDVMWYISQLANELDLSLGLIMLENLIKLESRARRGKISGDGDNR
jgi:NTP pyrophosphatase (non-canonical NTP hydrolase)